MFHGSIVALVTPMYRTSSGASAIDYETLDQLIDWHLDNKTDGIVILGTTGEAPTIEAAERAQIIDRTVRNVGGRVPVIVGTGSNSTAHTVRLTQEALERGADACLMVTPYYNKPTQQGLFEHFSCVAKAVSIPIILYNVPGRTACDLQPETVGRLSQIPTIVGLKEATGNLERLDQLLKMKLDLDLYSGDDETACEFMLRGGRGVISVTANVAPQAMHDLSREAIAGHRAEAEAINAPLMALHKHLFVEANPIPVKWALCAMGRIQVGLRLPLTPLEARHEPQVRDALQQAGLLVSSP